MTALPEWFSQSHTNQAQVWLSSPGPCREYQERPIDGIGLTSQRGFASLILALAQARLTIFGPVREHQKRPTDGIVMACQSGFASLMPTPTH